LHSYFAKRLTFMMSLVDKLVKEEDLIFFKLFNVNVNKYASPDQIHPRVLYELRNEIAFPPVMVCSVINNIYS